jgi:hypothetical protein
MFGRDAPALGGQWPAAIMASSARRVFIGYVVLAKAKAAEAGGDQTTPSRPPPTAIPMIDNSGAPLEHLLHPAVCKAVGMIAKSASRPGTYFLLSTFYFFRKWDRGGEGPGASPGVPDPPPGPSRRLAARGGKGELCTALAVNSLGRFKTPSSRTIALLCRG